MFSRENFLSSQQKIIDAALSKKEEARTALASINVHSTATASITGATVGNALQAVGAQLPASDPTAMFRQIFLITEASLETYIAQSRIQASTSFSLALAAGVAGFILILFGVCVAIFHPTPSTSGLTPERLSALSGVLTQFISAIFFFLYNRTLQQIDIFHGSLVELQELSVSILAGLQIADPTRLEKVLSILTNKQQK